MLIHFDFTLSAVDAEFLMITLQERIVALHEQIMEQTIMQAWAREVPIDRDAIDQRIIELQEEISRIEALKRQMINTAI